MELGLEDVQQTEAAEAAAIEAKDPERRSEAQALRRAKRGQLPDHLPRVETILDIEDDARPCCAGALHVIGEDRAERLDVIPTRFQVPVVRRPRNNARLVRRQMQNDRPLKFVELITARLHIGSPSGPSESAFGKTGNPVYEFVIQAILVKHHTAKVTRKS